MSKRKFDEDVDDVVLKKHSLDSDEEDEEIDAKNYEVMDEEDIEGQEDATIEFDGDIKITPFNMREELEEGHFDKDGNYFLNKDEDEIRDSWLDNIDWHKVKTIEKKEDKESDESESEADAKTSSADIFRKIVTYMNPSETILQTIKRLGKKSSTKANASSRWNTKKKNIKNVKKAPESEKKEENETDEEEDKRRMLEVTELADRLLHRGWMEIYQETYEKLSHRIRLQESGRLDLNKATNEDDSLDMFGEKFDATKADEPKASGSKEEETDVLKCETIEWEFKWENKEEAKVYGPHSSSEMQKWVDDGYFSDGVWVRRVDQPDSQFHTSKRVDFDLYI